MLPELTPRELRRYSRHLVIPEIGLAGQCKLKAASVLIVGVGGLGSAAALYLAAAGVGRLGLVDPDVVEESNLQRQVIHGMGMASRPKVESARQRLLDLNPGVRVEAFPQPFTSANAAQIAAGYEIIMDCSDNLPTRILTNDLCVQTGRPNIYGAVSRFEGQASIFYAKEGPCYRCLFPQTPASEQAASGEQGVLSTLPGTIGTIQAAEALKLILGIGSPLIGQLLLYNALEVSFEIVKIKKRPDCAVCGPRK